MNTLDKKKTIIVFIVLSSVFSIGLLSVQGDQLNAPQETDYGKININPHEITGAWWVKGYEEGPLSNEWNFYAEEMYALVENDPSLQDIFITCYGNSYNNTLFIALSDIHSEKANKILTELNPPESVSIKFVKGYASTKQLDLWIKDIPFGKMKKDGVEWTCFGKTENGTIIIGVDSIHPSTEQIIESHLKGIVPLNAIVVRIFPKIELNDYDSTHRPIKGGIEVGAYNDPTHNKESTMSFLGTVSGENGDFAIVSGHAVNDNDYVWQPGNTRQSWAYIGDSELTNNTNGGIGRMSDSGLVTVLSNTSAVSQVYGPSYNTTIVGQKNYSSQSVGNFVTMVGKESGYRSGTILAKLDCVTHPVWGYINNTVMANYYSVDGDSGGPIIQQYYQDGEWQSLAWGLHVGASGNNRYYSPVDGVETDFGIDFNFAGT